MKTLLHLITATVVALCSATARAQTTVPSTQPATRAVALSRDVIDAFAGQVVEKEYVHGLAVAIVNADGTKQVIGYGVDGAGRPIDGDTTFEIGSVSKVFTSLLLAQMVEQGEVKLDDPIQKFLPTGTKLAQALVDQPITLQDLATHHSGLPRMPSNFRPAAKDNPYADYTDAQLFEFLGDVTLGQREGEGAYSNVGTGLLGRLLALRAGSTYEDLLIARIARPLGMNATTVRLSDEQKRSLAHGHDADLSVARNWDLAPAFVGAGGIRSTANDMASFVAAQIDPSHAPDLAKAITLTHDRRAAMNANSDIALGWMIDKRRNTLWHNGETGGYHSYVAFSREARCGIVVLGDTASGAVDAVGARLMARMLGNDKVGPPLLRTSAKISNEAIDRLVGEYAMAIGTMTITRDGDKIFTQLTGQQRIRVYPQSEELLFAKVIEASLKFDLPAEATAKSMKLTLIQNGRNIPGNRIEQPPTTKPN